MSGYFYSDRQLRSWPPAAAAAGLWERARHFEHSANYWQARCLRAESRLAEQETNR